MTRPTLLLALTSALAAAHVAVLAPAIPAQDVRVRVVAGSPASSPDKPGGEEQTVFPTIQNALDHHPFAGPGGRVIIEIAPGTYAERIIVTQNHRNVTLVGMGKSPEDTVITNSLNAKQAGGTFFTETAEINGDGFEAANLTFSNTAGETGQAVAAAVRADRAVFKHVRFVGHQDTLFADYGRQYYLECFVTGGVDYIFGNAAAVFDRSELQSNGPGSITAQSRTSPMQPTGFVISNSRITSVIDPVSGNQTIGLGRPWRTYARVVIINTSLPANVDPHGWNNWGKPANEATAWFAEGGSTGAGASGATRVAWAHALSTAEASQFLPARFLRGTDHWNPEEAAARLP